MQCNYFVHSEPWFWTAGHNSVVLRSGLKGCITFCMIDPRFPSWTSFKKINMLMSCWFLTHKLVDSTKCRLQTADWMQTIVFRIRKQWDYQWLHSLVGWSVVPVFFSVFLRNCINCVHNCEDHSSFDFSFPQFSYMIYFIWICQWDYCCHVPICMVKSMFYTESSLQSSFCLYVIYWNTHWVT